MQHFWGPRALGAAAQKLCAECSWSSGVRGARGGEHSARAGQGPARPSARRTARARTSKRSRRFLSGTRGRAQSRRDGQTDRPRECASKPDRLRGCANKARSAPVSPIGCADAPTSPIGCADAPTSPCGCADAPVSPTSRADAPTSSIGRADAPTRADAPHPARVRPDRPRGRANTAVSELQEAGLSEGGGSGGGGAGDQQDAGAGARRGTRHPRPGAAAAPRVRVRGDGCPWPAFVPPMWHSSCGGVVCGLLARVLACQPAHPGPRAPGGVGAPGTAHRPRHAPPGLQRQSQRRHAVAVALGPPPPIPAAWGHAHLDAGVKGARLPRFGRPAWRQTLRGCGSSVPSLAACATRTALRSHGSSERALAAAFRGLPGGGRDPRAAGARAALHGWRGGASAGFDSRQPPSSSTPSRQARVLVQVPHDLYLCVRGAYLCVRGAPAGDGHASVQTLPYRERARPRRAPKGGPPDSGTRALLTRSCLLL